MILVLGLAASQSYVTSQPCTGRVVLAGLAWLWVAAGLCGVWRVWCLGWVGVLLVVPRGRYGVILQRLRPEELPHDQLIGLLAERDARIAGA
jgi:hypothetical protein